MLCFSTVTLCIGDFPTDQAIGLRLSVDYRYQRTTDPIVDYVLVPHGTQQTWKDIYRDWKSDKYQYFWHGYDLTPVPRELLPVVDEETRQTVREQ